MAVGERLRERRNYTTDASLLPYMTVAALSTVMQPASKSQQGSSSYGDEQRVPQPYQPLGAEPYKQNSQYDYLANDPFNWYNPTYPLNHNVIAYPMYQPGLNDAGADQGTKDDRATTLARQTSIPLGSLEQYILDSGFDYDQALDSLDLVGYGNVDNFSLEDYADLEKVAEEGGISFGPVIKKEEPVNEEGINISESNYELDSNTEQHQMNGDVDSDWTQHLYSNYPQSGSTVPVTSTDQRLDEVDKDLNDILDDFHPPTTTSEWQIPYALPQSNQSLPASQQFSIKTEPEETAQIGCDFTQANAGSSSCLPFPDEELIEMPVSQFNELLTTLTLEQSNLAKDIRRRGKNKKAARLCRKRKLDNISFLETGLAEMEEEKSRLLKERKQIVLETQELKNSIDSICEVLMKGLLSGDNSSSPSTFSLLHHSKGETFLVNK